LPVASSAPVLPPGQALDWDYRRPFPANKPSGPGPGPIPVLKLTWVFRSVDARGNATVHDPIAAPPLFVKGSLGRVRLALGAPGMSRSCFAGFAFEVTASQAITRAVRRSEAHRIRFRRAAVTFSGRGAQPGSAPLTEVPATMARARKRRIWAFGSSCLILPPASPRPADHDRQPRSIPEPCGPTRAANEESSLIQRPRPGRRSRTVRPGGRGPAECNHARRDQAAGARRSSQKPLEQYPAHRGARPMGPITEFAGCRAREDQRQGRPSCRKGRSASWRACPGIANQPERVCPRWRTASPVSTRKRGPCFSARDEALRSRGAEKRRGRRSRITKGA